MFTRIQVCRSVGISVNQLQYLHDMSRIPEPVTRINNTRLYTAGDVEAIRLYAETHGLQGRKPGRPRPVTA